MSKLGNRTRNLLGKWKSHSQSVDFGGSVLDSDGATMGSMGSDPSGLDGLAPNGCVVGSGVPVGSHGSGASVVGGAHGTVPGVNGTSGDIKPGTAKAQWSEHVWSKYPENITHLSETMNSM